jgi:hypothetical protein
MNILDFNFTFPNEHSFRMDMKEKFEAIGIICKNCISRRLYLLSTPYQWKCATYGFCKGKRGGIIMQDSNLTLMTWHKWE